MTKCVCGFLGPLKEEEDVWSFTSNTHTHTHSFMPFREEVIKLLDLTERETRPAPVHSSSPTVS